MLTLILAIVTLILRLLSLILASVCPRARWLVLCTVQLGGGYALGSKFITEAQDRAPRIILVFWIHKVDVPYGFLDEDAFSDRPLVNLFFQAFTLNRNVLSRSLLG